MTDVIVNAGTVVERDEMEYHAKDDYSLPAMIIQASRNSGRSQFAIAREMMKYARGKSKLKFAEYVQYGFHHLDRHTDAQKQEFISAYQHDHIVTECIDTRWSAVADDKWLSSVFLAADGTPQPETLAVVDMGERAYQNANTISTPGALQALLTDSLPFPLFCKYNNGIWSLGATVIEAADSTHIHLRGKEPISYQDFFRNYVGEHVFLIQKFVQNHAFLRQYTPTTATVRMVNMWTDEGLWTPHAILKMPSAQNDADNFWRTGNLVCNLDVETGEVLTIVGKKGPELVRHELHPETGLPLIGEILPYWQQIQALNERVAALHQPIRYSTQDIAITDDGPVEIEFNYGGAFELPQIATSRGFMTQRVLDFFRSCGSTRV
ncbi:sugar-transfer associated ATP-grasp domain-containing protein [Roseovarius aestuarii]|uniref:Alpha-L-glutamate ligase-related protein ATP-grasp domain-containing protein n=1 Tax=Roseovarius aestuarii TaxID=475083 RepID=A0A1X7BYV8_9RHOB|nr:sugar-transfer associated ATP-grasp domain-containing protein [Roseovarius aestuarii]SMC14459.1 hypothetical protein ROA7745_04326 [Roseovarius aestuarii]